MPSSDADLRALLEWSTPRPAPTSAASWSATKLTATRSPLAWCATATRTGRAGRTSSTSRRYPDARRRVVQLLGEIDASGA